MTPRNSTMHHGLLPGSAWTFRWGALIAVIVLLDQVSKFVFTAWLGPDSSRHRFDVVGTFIGFEYVRNAGVAFGLLSGQAWLVGILAPVVLIGLVGLFWRFLAGSLLLQVGTAFIAGGALGNVIDRFRLGYVVDFIAVGTFPRFNIADSAITIGIILIIWQQLVSEPDESSEHPDNEIGIPTT